MAVKTLYGLLIRYRDEERLRRGWLGRGGVARLILVRLKSHRVRVDDLSPGCHDLPRDVFPSSTGTHHDSPKGYFKISYI